MGILNIKRQISNVQISAPAFLEALDSQPWKGNIRELRNVIERSMIVRSEERRVGKECTG